MIMEFCFSSKILEVKIKITAASKVPVLPNGSE